MGDISFRVGSHNGVYEKVIAQYDIKIRNFQRTCIPKIQGKQ